MEDSVTEVEKLSLQNKEQEEEEGTAGREKEKSAEEGSGVITNFISALVSNGGNHKDDRGEIDAEVEADSDAGGGAGGLIDNIVSRLPTPLSDDAAPADEEACILIHSIVHD